MLSKTTTRRNIQKYILKNSLKCLWLFFWVRHLVEVWHKLIRNQFNRSFSGIKVSASFLTGSCVICGRLQQPFVFISLHTAGFKHWLEARSKTFQVSPDNTDPYKTPTRAHLCRFKPRPVFGLNTVHNVGDVNNRAYEQIWTSWITAETHRFRFSTTDASKNYSFLRVKM